MFASFFMSIIMSQFIVAAPLTAIDRLESFNCTLTSAAGVTRLQYQKNLKYEVTGIRNGWIPVQYRLNAVGPKHISLSGGGLAGNQFLSLSASSEMGSQTSTANGSIVLTKLGGSVFAPQQVSSIPVGQFYCSSLVIK